ncbi:MAG: hypothetical protein BWY75_02999 [bacterium ADurb.Bin425]|nr:MAG: hypothetical protein BWY75_02999 [bacterium ADurb.Bin425]
MLFAQSFRIKVEAGKQDFLGFFIAALGKVKTRQEVTPLHHNFMVGTVSVHGQLAGFKIKSFGFSKVAFDATN